MININNFDKIKKKYLEYWNKENHDRPLMDIRAARYDYRNVFNDDSKTLQERWLDIEYVVAKERAILEATYFAGEAYPLVNPNLGPDVFGAYFGCGLTFGEYTSWSTKHFGSLDDIDCSQLDRQNDWFLKTIELTKTMVNDSRGDYLVGITDIHPGMDGLVSLRGPQELCFDIYENPGLVKKLSLEMYDRFTEVYAILNRIISKRQRGSSNWMGIWHPKGWYVTSCDFMGMISQEMYQQFVEPEIKRELSFLKNSIFHLDGPGALRHLDDLLKIEELNGIQWVYGAGQPTAAHWIPVLKKIQDAGKLVHIDIVAEDLPILLKELKPEGVLYKMNCGTAQEADEMMKMAENSYEKKLF